MATIKLRRGTAAEWAKANPVLALGEPGVETDSGKMRIGDGTTRFTDLGAHLDEDQLTATISATVKAIDLPGRVVRLIDHGARFDRRAATFATTAGSNTVTASGADFTNADVNKLIFVLGAGTPAQPWNGALVANIVTVQSSTTVVVNVAASAAVSAVVGYIGTNNDAAWNAAHTKLTEGGTLILPAGHGIHATQKTPLSHVRYQGAGRGITVLHPVASVNGFIRRGTPADPLDGTIFTDFTIDGDMQTNGAGAASKGFGLYYMRNVLFEDVEVRNTAGSGFGNDFHDDCYYVRCRAVSNGRIGTAASPGHSGFGFGTGGWEHEHVFLIGCISTGNMRHGCFLEWQPDITLDNDWQSTPGLTVIGGRFEGNGISGISDQASGGAIVLGVHILDNALDGYSVNTTPPQLTVVGVGGKLADCVIRGNGRWGVDIYSPDVALLDHGRYRVENNIVEDNADHGIHLRAHARHVARDIEVLWNTVRRNAKNGIRIGGAHTRVRVVGNLCEDNGGGTDGLGAGLGGPDRNGIAIHGTVTNSEITLNVCRDTRDTGKSQMHGLLLTTAAPVSSLAGDSRVVGNDFRGNGRAAVAGYSQIAAPSVVRDNADLQPVGVESVAPTGSPMTYTAGAMAEDHYLVGAVTNVSVGGATVLIGPGTVSLAPHDVMVVTYTATPTSWKRRRR